MTITAKFSLGRLVATPGALEALGKAMAGINYVKRHASGDWGEVCAEDAASNDLALVDGSRVLSAYTLPTGVRIWIITEADRSATTILLPEEY